MWMGTLCGALLQSVASKAGDWLKHLWGAAGGGYLEITVPTAMPKSQATWAFYNTSAPGVSCCAHHPLGQKYEDQRADERPLAIVDRQSPSAARCWLPIGAMDL